jgi:hypothetical protein
VAWNLPGRAPVRTSSVGSNCRTSPRRDAISSARTLLEPLVTSPDHPTTRSGSDPCTDACGPSFIRACNAEDVRSRNRVPSAPAHPPQDVCVATPRPRARKKGAFGICHAVAPDGLAVAGGTPLHRAAGMVDAAQWCPAIATFLRFIAVPRPELLAPRNGGVGPPADDDRVSQATDPLQHLATTVRTNGHDSPLSNRVPIISGSCDIGADSTTPARPTCPTIRP